MDMHPGSGHCGGHPRIPPIVNTSKFSTNFSLGFFAPVTNLTFFFSPYLAVGADPIWVGTEP